MLDYSGSPPSKKPRKSSKKSNDQPHTDGTDDQGVQNPFNSDQIYSEIKEVSWMITTLQELKTLKENFEKEQSQLEGSGENVKNEVENQRKYLDDALKLFSQSVSKYIEICTEEIKKKSDNYENQIKSDNKKMLEKFMSQLVYEDKRDEYTTDDISRGFKNHMRLNIATAKIEYKLRRHLIPYIIEGIRLDWKRYYDEVPKKFQGLLRAKDPDESDFLKRLKVFIKRHKDSHIDNVSQLDHLDVKNELGMQNIHRVFEKFSEFFVFKNDAEFCYLMDKAKSMRNEVSHHILITDDMFKELKTKFLSALNGVKEIVNDEEHNIPNEIIDLINDLDNDDFEEIFNDPNPERVVNRRAGIEITLPPSFRANVCEKQKSPLEISGADYEGYIQALVNFFEKNPIGEVQNPSGFVNDIFEKFPLTRDWFYDGYKNNVTTQEGEDGNSKKEQKNQATSNKVFKLSVCSVQ